MIMNFMAEKLIITFDQYTKIVEKLAIEIHNNYKPTVLVGIMRGAAPILDATRRPPWRRRSRSARWRRGLRARRT